MVRVNPESPFHGQRPGNFIAGVINDQTLAKSAIKELQAKGYTDNSIIVLHGKEGAETLRHRGEKSGKPELVQRVRNVLEAFASGGADDVQRHIEAAEQGHYLIGVVLPTVDDGPRQEVRQILKSHGGYDIVLVRRSTVEVLDR